MTDSLAEAMHGRDWRRRVYRATCSACHGSGGADGGTLRCPTCDGRGEVWAAKANDGRCVYCGGEPVKHSPDSIGGFGPMRVTAQRPQHDERFPDA